MSTSHSIEMHVRVSKKGQIVIPKEIRDKLGIEEGSLLNLRIEEKRIIMEAYITPPTEIFIQAGDEITSPLIREVKSSSDKTKRLLEVLGLAKDSD